MILILLFLIILFLLSCVWVFFVTCHTRPHRSVPRSPVISLDQLRELSSQPITFNDREKLLIYLQFLPQKLQNTADKVKVLNEWIALLNKLYSLPGYTLSDSQIVECLKSFIKLNVIITGMDKSIRENTDIDKHYTLLKSNIIQYIKKLRPFELSAFIVPELASLFVIFPQELYRPIKNNSENSRNLQDMFITSINDQTNMIMKCLQKHSEIPMCREMLQTLLEMLTFLVNEHSDDKIIKQTTKALEKIKPLLYKLQNKDDNPMYKKYNKIWSHLKHYHNKD